MVMGMDQHVFFAALAVLIALARYGTYFYSIWQGVTKPHAFSWFLWSVITGIGAMAQYQLDGGPSAWALGFVSVTCFIIAFIAVFVGEKTYTRTDWLALFFCLVAIPVWYVTDNPVWALCMIMGIDWLTYYPTVRKLYHKPQTEPPFSFFLAGLRYVFVALAVPDPTWASAMYPLALMSTDWLVAGYIVVRRAQCGLPLHEYTTKTWVGKKPKGKV